MSSEIRPIVLRKKEAAKFIGLSVATLDRLRATGLFIRPIQLGEQAIGFLQKDLEEWVATRPVLAHFAESLDLGDDGDTTHSKDAV